MERRFSRLMIPGLVLALLASATSPASAAPPSRYYLALGDSLSVGTQPNGSGVSTPTNEGYADNLLTIYRAEIPELQLVKLGCIGETTTTMVQGGGLCTYPLRSHLAHP